MFGKCYCTWCSFKVVNSLYLFVLLFFQNWYISFIIFLLYGFSNCILDLSSGAHFMIKKNKYPVGARACFPKQVWFLCFFFFFLIIFLNSCSCILLISMLGLPIAWSEHIIGVDSFNSLILSIILIKVHSFSTHNHPFQIWKIVQRL